MDGVQTGTRLGDLVRRRIDAVYGGNQRAFARATGLSPQAVYSLVHDKITLPQAERRRVLARELGVDHLDLLVMAGELTADEIPGGKVPRAAFDPSDPRSEVVAMLRDVADDDLPAIKTVVDLALRSRR